MKHRITCLEIERLRPVLSTIPHQFPCKWAQVVACVEGDTRSACVAL